MEADAAPAQQLGNAACADAPVALAAAHAKHSGRASSGPGAVRRCFVLVAAAQAMPENAAEQTAVLAAGVAAAQIAVLPVELAAD